MLPIVLLGLVLLLLQTSLSAVPLAQNQSTSEPLESPLSTKPFVKNPLQTSDNSSPQATLRSFVENVNRAHQLLMAAHQQSQQESGLLSSDSVNQQVKDGKILFRRAQDCLDLSQIPFQLKEEAGIESTLLLKEILDRIPLPEYGDIPDAETVNKKGLTRWTIPGTEINIVKVEEGPRTGKFLFSPSTVKRLREFYKRVEQLPYKNNATESFYQFYISTPGNLNPSILDPLFLLLPSWMHTTYRDQTLWQWIMLWISFVITIWVLYGSLRWNLRKAATLVPPQRTWIRLFVPTIALIGFWFLDNFINKWINITGRLSLILSTSLEIIWWVLILLTLVLLGNALAETIIASPKINSKGLDAGAIRLVFRLSSLLIGTFILIIGFEGVGIALAPVLTGLGIGGAAVALAARPTLENIFGGLTLFADRPVKVGERCCFGDKDGYVKAIGLRSTRILAMNGDLISIPNAKFSELELINKSRRDRTLLSQTIGLRYETTAEQLRFVLVKLREMIIAHPKLLEENARVRFVKFGDYSLDIEIFVYVETGKLLEFLGIQEDLLLRVMDIVEAAGTEFAFPSQTTYLSQDSGLDQERIRTAEAQVQVWRSEQHEQLRNTLDFPPQRSPNDQ
ncbi:mechanosensitive ion channel family protein [Crocosphaera sp.]|uniref:mechanosensitive ion channel family protein n=1 Tax=Crocosphaera sp. TaxID=2729996 RepID=UPI003F2070C5|nr:mechanosensitive ion channel family protein [Crocosphaera sp.]